MASSYDFSRLRVLVIDESMFMQRLVHTILKSFGVRQVEFAQDGSSAIERLMKFAADVAICDWEMKPMNGPLFLRHLRMDKNSPNIYLPVVMLTAYTEQSKVEQARELGATEFLAKPVTSQGIYSRLVSMVENPRPFVRTETYFGPCRRRLGQIDFTGPDRRKNDGAADA